MTPKLEYGEEDAIERKVLHVTFETENQRFSRRTRGSDTSSERGRDEKGWTKDRGDPFDRVPSISFTAFEDFTEIFTVERMELIQTIKKHRPDDVDQVARFVERDSFEVFRDLVTLYMLGIIEYEGIGFDRPVVTCDDIQVDIPIPMSKVRTEDSDKS